jgi:hypothetical protein
MMGWLTGLFVGSQLALTYPRTFSMEPGVSLQGTDNNNFNSIDASI